jgi:thioredoxin-related protein
MKTAGSDASTIRLGYNRNMGQQEARRKSSRRRPSGTMLVAIVFVFAVVMNLVTSTKKGGDVAWAGSYAQGMAQAKRERKPVLLSLSAPGCGWCKKMDADTFRDKQVVAFARSFVCIGLNYSTDAALVDKYRAVEFPLTIILSPDGQEIARWTGFIPPDRFLAALQAVHSQLK